MDEFYKIVFSFPRLVRDLVRGFLPETLTADLDLGRMEALPASYVSDDWRRRHGDRVWRIPYRRDRGWPPGAYVALLLEFQSTVDATMPVRMLVYSGLLFQELLRGREGLPGERSLPHVLPMVVYNGRRRWSTALSVEALALPVSAVTDDLQPRQSYVVLDEWQRSADDLPSGNLISSLIGLETGEGEALDRAVAELARLLDDPVDAQIRRSFSDWIERLRPHRTPVQGRSYTAMLMEEPMTLLESVNERLQKYYDRLEREAIVKGIEQGIEQGTRRAREQLLVEERMLLRRLAERRFGPEAASRLAGVLADAADNDAFAAIGDAIIDSASGDDLLGRVAGNAAQP